MPAKPGKRVKRAKAKSTRKAKPAASAKRVSKATPKAAKKAVQPKPETARKLAKESAPAVRRTSAELHFTETTILRGQAVEPGEATPSGATHEIAGHDDCGQPILKRKRFSIY